MSSQPRSPRATWTRRGLGASEPVTEQPGLTAGTALAAEPNADGAAPEAPDTAPAVTPAEERSRRRAARARERKPDATSPLPARRIRRIGRGAPRSGTRARRRGAARELRGLAADWLILAGGVLVVGSLFLTWSHQISPSLLALYGSSSVLRGIPHNPTAWQLYSIADLLLAALGVSLAVVAAVGSRTARMTIAGAAAIAVGFVLHAISTPPTNGVSMANPATVPATYYPNHPTAGIGATVALIGLVVALVGLALSFTSD
jgi:hypothetical protein